MRPSGNWNPRFLGSALKGWWEAADLSAGAVSSWVDRVGSYNVVQATGSKQPVASLTSFNGRPGVAFDGVDDEMTLVGVPAGIPTGSSPVLVLALVRQDALASDASTRYAAAIGTGATGLDTRFGRTSSGTANVPFISANALSTAGRVSNFDSYAVTGGWATATAEVARHNGIAHTERTISLATGTTRLRIGAGANSSAANFWNGLIAKLIVVAPPPMAEIEKLEAWMAWDCAMPNLMDPNHPYRWHRP